MREPQPRTIYLKDYTQPAFLIDSIELDIDLRPGDALVKARQALRRNARATDPGAPLALDGEELELVSVALDGTLLRANAYAVTPERLTIAQVP